MCDLPTIYYSGIISKTTNLLIITGGKATQIVDSGANVYQKKNHKWKKAETNNFTFVDVKTKISYYVDVCKRTVTKQTDCSSSTTTTSDCLYSTTNDEYSSKCYIPGPVGPRGPPGPAGPIYSFSISGIPIPNSSTVLYDMPPLTVAGIYYIPIFGTINMAPSTIVAIDILKNGILFSTYGNQSISTGAVGGPTFMPISFYIIDPAGTIGDVYSVVGLASNSTNPILINLTMSQMWSG